MESSIPRVMVSEAVTPTDTRILARGNWMDDSGEDRNAGDPRVSRQARHRRTQGDRLDLANWLVRPDNPLTARVTVNRSGASSSAPGFRRCWTISARRASGRRIPNCWTGWPRNSCSPPTRPQGTHAWDVKHLIRTIVTSQTYRQSSMSTPELDERDPDNRLLARQSRFRVEAEVVRDIALSVSGLLVEKFGGPSAKPYRAGWLSGHAEFPQARVRGKPRRRSLPPRTLYLLAAQFPAPQPAHVRCAHARRVHRQSREFQYSAAGAGAAQRPDLRGGGARLRAEYSAARAAIGTRDRLGLRTRRWAALR